MKIVKQAQQIIRERKQDAEQQSQKVLQTLYGFADYDAKDIQIREQILVVANAYDTPQEQKERTKLAKLRQEQEKIAAKYGYLLPDTQPKYHCPLCNDSGMVDGKYCKCLKAEIRQLTYQQCRIFNADFTFENSNNNGKEFIVSKEWCDKYPNVKITNMVFSGKTGVGKTYLCSCIANCLIEKQVDVLFITSYNLNQKFLQVHTADIQDKQDIIDSYEDAEVLIIDDLGAEPTLKNVTEEYLFSLINQRLVSGKATIFSTNLGLDNILQRYGERVFSRLTDKRTCLVMGLDGTDKRHE